MSAVKSMTNRQAMDLVESWGYVRKRTNGGRVTMSHPTAGTVALSAPGVRTDNQMEKPLREAAKQLGVDYHVFVQGPPKPPRRPKAEYVKFEKLVLPPMHNGNGHGNGHHNTGGSVTGVTPTPECANKQQPSVTVLNFLREKAGINYKLQEIATRCGLTRLQAGCAIRHLLESGLHPELARVAHGVYCWKRSAEVSPPPVGLHCFCFEHVETDPDSGRHLLRKGDSLFVAVPFTGFQVERWDSGTEREEAPVPEPAPEPEPAPVPVAAAVEVDDNLLIAEPEPEPEPAPKPAPKPRLKQARKVASKPNPAPVPEPAPVNKVTAGLKLTVKKKAVKAPPAAKAATKATSKRVAPRRKVSADS